MDIFSKKDGPRREDVVAKKMISENRATISKLADVLSNGAYSASRQAASQRQQKPDEEQTGSRFHIIGGAPPPREPEPYLKASLNGRVVIVNGVNSRQMAMLGEFKVKHGQKYFCLATADNGYISPLPTELAEPLAKLDGVVIESDEVEEKLLEFIRRAFEIP